MAWRTMPVKLSFQLSKYNIQTVNVSICYLITVFCVLSFQRVNIVTRKTNRRLQVKQKTKKLSITRKIENKTNINYTVFRSSIDRSFVKRSFQNAMQRANMQLCFWIKSELQNLINEAFDLIYL